MDKGRALRMRASRSVEGGGLIRHSEFRSPCKGARKTRRPHCSSDRRDADKITAQMMFNDERICFELNKLDFVRYDFRLVINGMGFMDSKMFNELCHENRL